MQRSLHFGRDDKEGSWLGKEVELVGQRSGVGMTKKWSWLDKEGDRDGSKGRLG